MKRFFALALVLVLFGCAPKHMDAACRIAVSAETVTLPSEYLELVPEDGVLFSADVAFETGEDLLSVMRRAMREENLPLVFEGGYISAIGGLATGGAGEMSGWM